MMRMINVPGDEANRRHRPRIIDARSIIVNGRRVKLAQWMRAKTMIQLDLALKT
jgi:hypothetical protein